MTRTCTDQCRCCLLVERQRGCIPIASLRPALNRLSVLSIPIISCIQYPGMYNRGWGGGGGGVTGDVGSVANS